MPGALVTLQLRSEVAPQIAQTADAYKQLSAAEQKAEAGAARYAQALQKVALADAKTATEEQRKAVQTANAAKAQDQASLAALRLANAQNKVATGNSFAAQTANAFKSQLLGIVGPAAIATAALAAIKGAIDATGDAVALRETQNALRAVSGSATIYAQAIATARNQQLLFGGSLQANIEGLQGLVITSRDSGAALKDLVDLSQRLNVKSPEQGISGARTALAEAFGEGNITSLAKRFEIPRDKIAALRDTSISAAEKVRILSDYLDGVGISSAAVAGKVDADALAFRRLKQDVSDARLALGDFIATAAAAPVRGIYAVIDAPGEANRVTGDLVKTADSYAQYVQRIQASNDQLQVVDPLSGITTGAPLTQLTETQFTYARALEQTGVASADAVVQAANLTDEAIQGAGAFNAYAAAARDAAAGNHGIAESALAGGGAFNAYTAAVGGTGSAAQAAAAQIQFFGQAADISARASVADASAKDAQQAKTALLTAESQKAADAFLGLNPQIDAAGVAALVAAGKLDPFIGRLIALQIESGKAKDELIKLNNAQAQGKINQLVGLRSGQGISSGRGGGSDAAAEGQAFADSLKRQADAAKQATDDQIAYAKATGDTATARKLLNTQLAAAKRAGDLGEQARIIDSLAALDKKGNSGRITAAESTALRLNDIARTSGDDRARIERENQEKLRDAQLDFDVRRSRAEEDYQEKRRKLLISGHKAQGPQVKALDAEFAKDQRRAQEDFDRQNRRTVRNNQESLGDQSTRVGNRVESVNARTAARGGTVAGLPSAPGTGGDLPALPSANAKQTAATLTIQGVITLDGKAVGTAIYPTIEVLIDDSLAVSLQASGIPGSGQSSVGGPG